MVPNDLKALPNHNGLCVKLDGFGKAVPIPAAAVFATNFTNGLVTRLVLGEYVRSWRERGVSLPTNILDLSIDARSFDTGQLDAYVQIGSYKDKDKLKQFDKALSELLQKVSLQSGGMLWGWQAGTQLDRFRDSQADKAKLTAVWALLKNRYSVRQLGEIVGYTLNYLLAYSQVQAMLKAKGIKKGPDAESLVVQGIGNASAVADNMALVSSFQDALLAELQAASAASGPGQVASVERARQFLQGFDRGSFDASDHFFYVVFREGYEVGYNDGFKTGYSKGYAAGYHDGFSAGYNDAWAKANEVMGQLRDGIGGGSGGGVIDKILDGVGKVTPVIMTILSLF